MTSWKLLVPLRILVYFLKVTKLEWSKRTTNRISRILLGILGVGLLQDVWGKGINGKV